jgi:hypothetical protein
MVPGGYDKTATHRPDGQAGSYLYRKSAPNVWTAMR